MFVDEPFYEINKSCKRKFKGSSHKMFTIQDQLNIPLPPPHSPEHFVAALRVAQPHTHHRWESFLSAPQRSQFLRSLPDSLRQSNWHDRKSSSVPAWVQLSLGGHTGSSACGRGRWLQFAYRNTTQHRSTEHQAQGPGLSTVFDFTKCALGIRPLSSLDLWLLHQ